MDYKLSASILSADFGHLEDDLKQAQKAGVDWLHIDVMDGHFVPNISMGPFIVKKCRELSSLPLDVHLMIEKPENHIHAFIKAGANFISIHPEGNPNVVRTLQEIKQAGCQAGLAINPGTSISSVVSILDFVDMVLILTVNPGFSGQAFLPQVVSKIEELNQIKLKGEHELLIQVDGGISAQNIKTLHLKGARVFVAATSIFGYPKGIEAGVQALHEALL